MREMWNLIAWSNLLSLIHILLWSTEVVVIISINKLKKTLIYISMHNTKWYLEISRLLVVFVFIFSLIIYISKINNNKKKFLYNFGEKQYEIEQFLFNHSHCFYNKKTFPYFLLNLYKLTALLKYCRILFKIRFHSSKKSWGWFSYGILYR